MFSKNVRILRQSQFVSETTRELEIVFLGVALWILVMLNILRTVITPAPPGDVREQDKIYIGLTWVNPSIITIVSAMIVGTLHISVMLIRAKSRMPSIFPAKTTTKVTAADTAAEAVAEAVAAEAAEAIKAESALFLLPSLHQILRFESCEHHGIHNSINGGGSLKNVG